MWLKIASFILKNRVALLIILLISSAFMGWQGRKLEMSYSYAKVVPPSDEDAKYFAYFKKLFGQDDNIIALGVSDEKIYQLKYFKRWQLLLNQIENSKFYNVKRLEGYGDSVQSATGVIGLGKLPYLYKNQTAKKFEPKPIFPDFIESQAQLDSLIKETHKIGFYKGQIINEANHTSLAVVTVQGSLVNTVYNRRMVETVKKLGEKFTADTGIEIHYAGVPYIRVAISKAVESDMSIALIFSALITGVCIFLFFRSFTPVFVSLGLIVLVVLWTVGIIALLGYKITLLTALLPPILVVIGIPNCVYFITKYHQECAKHGDKLYALRNVVQKIGVVTLITNMTTAIGFLVLAATGITVLSEFGIAAGVSIMATFFISLVFLPIAFHSLPLPSTRKTKHLEANRTNRILSKFDYLVLHQRKLIYIITLVIVAVALVGFMRVKALSFMVDDLPEDTKEKQDIAFLEKNFKGTMPIEIIVDTGKPKAYRKAKTLKKIEAIETYVDSSAHLSKPISLVSFIKAANQAYFNNNEKEYQLPDRRTGAYVMRYLRGQNDPTSLSSAFVDSTQQFLRVSLKVADIGSIRLDSLIKTSLQPALDRIFSDSTMSAKVTGTTPLFIKGNTYLISNLQWSLILACVLVALLMGLLFQNIRMMLIAVVPNLIPLLVTAGIMGYFGISLKPSTALVFSIAFGISVDDSLHFLARFRQELLANSFDRKLAVQISLQETGKSMIYTSLILFAGFIIFTFSSFGGIIALGLLTSITLLVAMFTNLILLPSLLLTFHANVRHKVRA